MRPREIKRKKSLEQKKVTREKKTGFDDTYDFNYLITLEYDGYSLGGYAKQRHQNTVQNHLEDALSTVLKKSVKTTESSRTDAKVHARDQKVMFKYYKSINLDKLKESLNNMMIDDINIIRIESVSTDFHCRYDVKDKTYCYYISKEYSVFNRKYKYYHKKPLNVDLMRQAANQFVGEHDFTTFCSARATQESKVRTINSIDIKETKQDIIISINGSGFLYNMVRIIVGTLLDVSDNKRHPNHISEILELKNRKKAGETAPAYALYLDEIKY